MPHPAAGLTLPDHVLRHAAGRKTPQVSQPAASWAGEKGQRHVARPKSASARPGRERANFVGAAILWIVSWHPILGRRALHATPCTTCHPASEQLSRRSPSSLASSELHLDRPVPRSVRSGRSSGPLIVLARRGEERSGR